MGRRSISLLAWGVVACTGDPALTATPESPSDDGVSVLQPRYIEPVGVGFEYDGVVLEDGTLTGYRVDGKYWDPVIYLVFATEEFFEASSEEVESTESCFAWGRWEPDEALTPLATEDGATLFHSYEGHLVLEGDSCWEVLDPDEWGVDGADFIAQFDGMHLGVGFGAFTDNQAGVWSAEVVDLYGDAMVASYFAVNGPEGEFVASDLSTCFAFEVDDEDRELLADEEGFLIAQEVTDSLPQSFLRSIATQFLLFDGMDLEGLKAP